MVYHFFQIEPTFFYIKICSNFSKFRCNILTTNIKFKFGRSPFLITTAGQFCVAFMVLAYNTSSVKTYLKCYLIPNRNPVNITKTYNGK